MKMCLVFRFFFNNLSLFGLMSSPYKQLLKLFPAKWETAEHCVALY